MNSNNGLEQFCSVINKLQIDYIKIIDDLKKEVLKLNKKNKILEEIAFKAIENSENASENNKNSSAFYIETIEKMKKDILQLIKINDDLTRKYSKSVLQNQLISLDLKEKKEIIAYFESKNYELFVPNYSNDTKAINNEKYSNDIIEIKNRLKKILKTEEPFLIKINYLSDILLKNDFIFNSISTDLLYLIKEIDVNIFETDKDAYPVFFKLYNEISKVIDYHCE